MALQARVFDVQRGQPGYGSVEHFGDSLVNWTAGDTAGESGSQVRRLRLESQAVHLGFIRFVMSNIHRPNTSHKKWQTPGRNRPSGYKTTGKCPNVPSVLSQWNPIND